MARSTRSMLGAIALTLALAAAPLALRAQETGGSFGGSDDDWGGSSSSDEGWGGSLGGSDDDWGGSSSSDEHWGGSLGGSDDDWGGSSSSDEHWGGSSSSDEHWGDSSSTDPVGRVDPWEAARVRRGEAVTMPVEREVLAGRPPPTWALRVVWAAVFFGSIAYANRDLFRRGRADAAAIASAAPLFAPPAASVRRISVGLHASARAEVQQALRALATTARTGDGKGRAAAARQVIAVLRAHAGSVMWWCAETRELPAPAARASLAAIAQDLRARYRAETVAAPGSGRALGDAPDRAPSESEGPGMLVVSLVIGATGSLAELPAVRRSPDVPAALDRALGAARLAGLEVVWSPSEERDRLSSYELERIYPELRRLEDATEVGAARCEHCGGNLPRELARCPHCGAPIA